MKEKKTALASKVSKFQMERKKAGHGPRPLKTSNFKSLQQSVDRFRYRNSDIEFWIDTAEGGA